MEKINEIKKIKKKIDLLIIEYQTYLFKKDT